MLALWQLLISHLCCSHWSGLFPSCLESGKNHTEMCQHVISFLPLLISPSQVSFQIYSRLFTILREVTLQVFDVTTSSPHHLAWRVFTAPYTKNSCKISRLISLPSSGILLQFTLYLNGYRLLPFPLTLQLNRPNQSTSPINSADGPCTLPVPA